MSLSSGSRIGPYEVVAPLGAGGMGEVYRARDTKLGREIAIKVLPSEFADDRERVARFQREAQLLASLNHPHIATIHGLEEANGTQFLVMELVEGGTLTDRLARGAEEGLSVAEALAIAHQVADALQAAHEKGIIHRDLKPANIAFTATGQVKVLDFGLAKALGPADGHPVDSPALITHSPTLSVAATQPGVILGTAAYMAPEQARGKTADKRCDIWAFGCVLYEMLTGKRAFAGVDMTDTLAAVLRSEPDWQALPADVSPTLQALIRGCLQKDRLARIADIAAALFVLDKAGRHAREGRSEAEVEPGPRRPGRITLAARRCLRRRGHGCVHARRPRSVACHWSHAAAPNRSSDRDHTIGRNCIEHPRLELRPGDNAGRSTRRVSRAEPAVCARAGPVGANDADPSGSTKRLHLARRSVGGILRRSAQEGCGRRRNSRDTCHSG